MSSEKEVQPREKSRCKPVIARNGPKFESRTAARESRKRCGRGSLIPFSPPKKLARELARAWPLHAPWWLTNTMEPFTSKPKRGRERLSSFAFPRTARLLPPRRCPRETHLVRG